MPSILLKNNRNHLDVVAQGRLFANFREIGAILLTFSLTVFAWIFFRANSLTDAFHFIGEIFSASTFTKPEKIENVLVWLILAFVMVEWLGREQQYAIARLGFKWPRILRVSFYLYLVFAILWFRTNDEVQFIYFQF